MSRYESWLEEQLQVVGDGTTVIRPSRIVLEVGGDTFGTWPVGDADLIPVVSAVVSRIGEDLPKGTHAGKLLAIDSSGQVLAQLPLNVRGQSAVATDTQIPLQRAMAIAVANLETTSHVLREHLEIVAANAQQATTTNLQLQDALMGILNARSAEQVKIEQEAARQERMNMLAQAMIPVGLQIVSALAERLLPLIAKIELPAAPAAPPEPPEAPAAPPEPPEAPAEPPEPPLKARKHIPRKKVSRVR